jgi:hypothetical protein
MLKRVLGFGIVCSVIVGCSGNPNGSAGTDQVELNEIGEVTIPLTTQTGDTIYRLASAKFTITGATLGGKPLTITAPPDEHIHKETLASGSYAILLQDGWQLQAMSAVATLGTATDTKLIDVKATAPAWVNVEASLISPNPAVFAINRSSVTNVYFNFATAAGVVNVGKGDVNIHIGVNDCSSYDQFTAALGVATVDCLGTIGPDSYVADSDGSLHPNFNSCPLEQKNPTCIRDPKALRERGIPLCTYDTIKDLLSVQNRQRQLPLGKQCVAGRYLQWRDSFLKSGITSCPNWVDKQVFNAPSRESIAKQIAPAIQRLPRTPTGEQIQFVRFLKTFATYHLEYPTPPPDQKCQTPADCAIQCGGGFPGFVIAPRGVPIDENTIATDPTYWLADDVYTDFDNDPFWADGYFHPMSYYGPLPGVLAGHRARSYLDEQCSYFDGTLHTVLNMRINCLDNADLDSCISLCLPDGDPRLSF